MRKLLTLMLLSSALTTIGCSSDSSDKPLAPKKPETPSAQKISRCEALEKSYQCLSRSINHFTDYAFDITDTLQMLQSDDRMSAKDESGEVTLNFHSPITIPKKNFQDILTEVSFTTERDSKLFFEYTSFTNIGNYNYTDKYYYSVKYPDKSFSLSVINNYAYIACDNGESYQIEDLKNASSECESQTSLPYINVSTINLGPDKCGMNFQFLSPGSELLDFRSQSFLLIGRPLSQSCK